MFVYPVKYRIRPDKILVRTHESCPGSDCSSYLSFDDFFQMFSSLDNYKQQINDSVIYAVRNQNFSCFFVFGEGGVLHLFNSRGEVTRFLRS